MVPDYILDLLGAVVAVGFALTFVIAAWAIPVFAVAGIIALFHKDTQNDQPE